MADEIITRRFTRARGGFEWTGYFIDDLSPKIVTDGGVDVIVTASAGLPADDLVQLLFTSPEIEAFNDGSKMWTAAGGGIRFFGTPTSAEVATRLRTEYAKLDDDGNTRVQATRNKYRFLGRRVTP